MADFSLLVSTLVEAQVEFAPVQTALNTLAVLNLTEKLSELAPWAHKTAAALSPERRHLNRIVCEGLIDALVTDDDWPSFPEYIAALAAQRPTELRDRVVQRLSGGAGSDVRPLALEQILTDPAAYLARVAELTPDISIDIDLYTEVHALLNDPAQLQKVVVEHLRAMMQVLQGPELERLDGSRRWLVDALKRRVAAGVQHETVATFIGRELTDAQQAQIRAAHQLVFVPSEVLGGCVTTLRSSTTLWLFFGILPERALLLRSSPVEATEMALRLDALADETRLRILALIAEHGELSGQEIITRLDLNQPTASRHLKYLTTTSYLQERRHSGASKVYRLRPTYIAATFYALERFLAGMPLSEDARQEQPLTLRRFLDAEARVTIWPARDPDQMLVMRYLVDKFTPGREYTEREVNTLLNAWHTYEDPATLRRMLIDNRLLQRKLDGRAYWRAVETTDNPVP